VFWAFRVMVGVGMLMLASSWCRPGRCAEARQPLPRMLMRGLVLMTFSGWAATLAGWYVTEIGRQPWLVYGILTTAQAVTKVPGTLVASTLALYLLLYVVLIVAYVAVIFHLARKGTPPAPLTEKDMMHSSAAVLGATQAKP
jgi:cytochrome d ubiquinol oxidase subunit I